ncbi:hypothetical protein E2C01_003413 [Portunus trituberculatus]|uniref:Uncharacterized protein n=1 Tax=Portunus trituberculatus TaxID=210409 RepID=A0A5B7CM60_PORTR|nr:hypothetical protein [Portunus trituberculatus]
MVDWLEVMRSILGPMDADPFSTTSCFFLDPFELLSFSSCLRRWRFSLSPMIHGNTNCCGLDRSGEDVLIRSWVSQASRDLSVLSRSSTTRGCSRSQAVGRVARSAFLDISTLCIHAHLARSLVPPTVCRRLMGPRGT